MITTIGNAATCAPASTCGCGCDPCACGSGTACLSDFCVPRPSFFNGQLVTADDLNAVVTYFNARTAQLARYTGSWGIFGGYHVAPAPGVAWQPLKTGLPPGMGPRILAGTTVEISLGYAIDALGRSLVSCGPAVLDLAQLAAKDPTVPETKPCSAWFAIDDGLNPSMCDPMAPEDLTAREYWLVVEATEQAIRPVPRYSSGGACDPAPSCDFSRRLEGVRFRLVRTLPEYYPVTGCLDNFDSELDGLANVDAQYLKLSTYLNGNLPPRGTAEPIDAFLAYSRMMDFLSQRLGPKCCAQPAVVLGRVLLTSSPGDMGQGLPSVATYAILQEAYPARRVGMGADALTFLTNVLRATMP